ncbi:MAG: PPC domain-containing protein [Phycisphaerae bacterium]|nr:PPC domain-containing protein [Phycisphaerae bacterium]
MKTLQTTLVSAVVLAGVLVGVSAAGAGETVIKNGQAISGFRGSSQSTWVGRIYVPTGARQFVVSTSGGYGDCDLYLRREQGNQGSWDFRSKSNSNDERIALAMPAEGWWQVGLIAAGEYSDLTLHAQFDEPLQQFQPQPVQVLQVGGVDEFEPNSKRELAMQIFAGQGQLHTINPDGDEDWIMFVPRQSGRYVLQLTNVTVDLKGELWAQAGRDKEKRAEKFDIPRGRDSELLLEVDSTIGYFKLRIEADDNDDVGSYGLSVKQVSTSVDRQLNRRRPDVFESDNRSEVAVGILDNTPQLRTIYPRDDEDWLVFAPERPGEYLLKFSNVTTDLKGELWVRIGDDKERRIDKFDVSRWGRTISLRADHNVRYFKIRIEADDNDETGDYRLDVVARSIGTAPAVLRTTVIYPTLRIPPIYRHHRGYRNRYPSRHGRRHAGHHSGRGVGIIPRILGSVLGGSGRVTVGVGVGRSRRIAPTSGRSRVTSHGGRSRSRTTAPTRSTVRTPTRISTPTRGTVRTPTRISTPTRRTVRTPTRISTPTRRTVRTPTRISTPTRSTVRTPTRISTPTRSTVRTPTRTPTRTTVRKPSRTRTYTRTRGTVRTPTRTPTRRTTVTPRPTGSTRSRTSRTYRPGGRRR